MKEIFIDANIYMNFFDSNKPELKRLLDSLVEIKDSLFISSQIVDEVNRNKLDVAQRSLGNHFNNLSNINKNNKQINLPEHLEIGSTSLQAWNSQSNKIYKENEKLYEELEDIIKKTLKEIMCSNDKVSQIFHLLFKDAVVASEHEIQEARYRREVGNPPGKPNDPLGDQISWEQFKNFSRNSENILIITNDRDYYTDFKGEIYLNSFLYNELVKTNTNTNPSIFCFDSLAKGLDYFRKISSKKIDKLPKEEDLKIIAEEELSNPLPLSNDIFRQVHDINRQFKQRNQSSLESINLQLNQLNYSASPTYIEQILKMIEKS
jgi:hypothetical protein